MSFIVRDDGFHPDDLEGCEFASVGQLDAGVEAPVLLQLEPDADPVELPRHFPWISAIRIRFPDFNDGRGFSLAFRLRQLGFAGRLGANGHLIADQYPLARRSGFDEVVIDAARAARQPEPQWLSRSGWRQATYQQRLLGRVGPASLPMTASSR